MDETADPEVHTGRERVASAGSEGRYRTILNTADGELIDDRELDRFDADRFRHRDVADLLAEIAATARTPANIALYGPWGSGKSGVGNLIANRLADNEFKAVHGRTVYFRFDAFQYSAQLPMRRAFLVNLARKRYSEKRAKAEKKRLYAAETSNVFDPARFWPSVWRYIVVIALILGVVTLIDAIFGALGSTGIKESLAESASRVIAPAVAPAVFIAGVIAFLNNQLTVTRTTVPPATDDEFEALFETLVRDILRKRRARRMVVFIDELDRCAPGRVVDVLDTVRTFLDAKETIFIIAADREVLEQALSEKVSQSTATDLTNPYYSSGSEYLDKVFHYQTSLAPLLPQRVTAYAMGLVKDQPGVWAEPDVHELLPEIMSILIPSHVRSPRRVKTLLNNFIVAFHTARLREQAGQLDRGPEGRLPELAKLVCLRTEFPRFGRDLALSDRLPDYFRLIADGKERPGHVPTAVWAVAESYFVEEQGVDTMLDRSTGNRASTPPEGELDGGLELEVRATTTRRAIMRQLDFYLQKTRRIQNPRRDLIFMEQSGHTYGLPSDLAEELEQIAVENRVQDALEVLAEDRADHEAILRYLSGLAAQSFPGVEGENVVSVLLAVSDVAEPEAVAAAANQAVGAVMAHRRRSDLSGDDLPGALALGLKADGPDAAGLVLAVLSHDAVLEDREVGLAAMRRLRDLPAPGSIQVARISCSLIFDPSQSESFIAAMGVQEPGVVGEMLTKARPLAASELNEIGESTEPLEDERLDAFIAVFEFAWNGGSATLREGLLCMWLASDMEAIEPAMIRVQVAGETLETAEATKLLLRELQRLEADELAPWLSLLSSDCITPAYKDDVSALVGSVWERRSEWSEDDLEASLALLPELIRAAKVAKRRFEKPDSVDLDDYQKLANRAAFWGDSLRFEGAGTHSNAGNVVVGEVASAFSTIHGSMQPPQIVDYQSTLIQWARVAIASADEDERFMLVQAIHTSPWLDRSERFRLCVELSATLVSLGATTDHVARLRDLHSVEEIVSEIGGGRDPNGDVTGSWIRAFNPDVNELRALVDTYLVQFNYAACKAVRVAVAETSSTLSDAERLYLAKCEIERLGPTSHEFLEDISFDTLNQHDAAGVIVQVFARGSSLSEQQSALDLWKALQPNEPRVRKRLIQQVLLAGLEGQAAIGWFDLLLKNTYLRLWESPPYGTKEPIKNGMAKLATTGARRKRLKAALQKNNISTVGLGGLLERLFGS